jgi:hypothetical protein
MMHWITTAWNTYVLHPERGNGYQWWSGIGSDFGEVTIVAAILATLRHRNCHEKGCWRLGHPHPEHGFPTCRRHYHRALDTMSE